MPKQNQAVRSVQADLIKRFLQLQRILDQTTNEVAAKAIVREMQELNHRITVAGSLLFASGAAKLDPKAEEVRKASNRAAKAIRDFETAKEVMGAITGFLGVVDEFLDLAKLA